MNRLTESRWSCAGADHFGVIGVFGSESGLQGEQVDPKKQSTRSSAVQFRPAVPYAIVHPVRRQQKALWPSRENLLQRTAGPYMGSKRRFDLLQLTHGVYWLAPRKHLRFSIVQTVPDRQSLP